MELKLIKYDESFKDLSGQLKEFWSAWTIVQRAYGTPWMERDHGQATRALRPS